LNALQVIRWLSGSDPEYVTNVLDHQFEEPISWRLDFGRGKWIYLEWAGSCMVASSTVPLTDDEIYGFFKGKLPEFDIRAAMKFSAIALLQKIIEEVKKEA
jgi:hypothetical protein